MEDFQEIIVGSIGNRDAFEVKKRREDFRLRSLAPIILSGPDTTHATLPDAQRAAEIAVCKFFAECLGVGMNDAAILSASADELAHNLTRAGYSPETAEKDGCVSTTRKYAALIKQLTTGANAEGNHHG